MIGKVLGLVRFKFEIKGKVFFSCSFIFLNSFWGVFKALLIPAFIIFSGLCCPSSSVSSSFNLIAFKNLFQ